MSVHIRKLLSRKFNNVCFEFGRSPDLRTIIDLPTCAELDSASTFLADTEISSVQAVVFEENDSRPP